MKASSITFETWNLILSSFPSKLVDFVHYFKYQLSFYTEKLNENPINPNQKIKEVKLVVIIIPSNILTSIQTSFPPNIALKQSRSQCREYRLQWWRWTSVSDVGPVCFLFSCCCWVGYQLNRTGLGWAGLGWMFTFERKYLFCANSQQEGIQRNGKTNYSNIGVR